MKSLFYFLWGIVLLSQQAFAQTITWTGATDTDWATGTNWSTNVAPTNTNKVNIPGSLARYPVLNTNTSIQNLVVEAGATLTVNASKELTINGSGNDAVLTVFGTVANNGTITVNQVTSATANAVHLSGDGQFTNNAGATLTAATIGFYGIRVEGNAVLINQSGGTFNAAGFSGSMFLSGSTSPEMVQNHGKMTLGGQIEKYAGLFHNYPCGVVKLVSGEVYNNGGQLINEGFFSAAANLNGPAADFINNGIVYVVGSANYTNNAIRIFNNATSTSIFEFATANSLTVAGIYKNEAASTSAGGFNQGTNTFTHFGLSAGSQTLYANITRAGGTCPQIVPFTFEVATASIFTTQPTSQTVCAGSSASFTVAIANATGYQWQIDAGSGWTNLAATSPYTNVNSATLNISNATGLNGYQYRCVATGPGGGTLTSNAATLTIGAGGGSNPTGTLTWTGLVDTDWNTACNWSPSSVPTATNDVVVPNTTNKPIINIAAVAKSVEVQAGAVLTINATKSLTINGSKTAGLTTSGFYNIGTVHNYGQLILGNTSSVGSYGFLNTGTFNNNLGAEITIDRAAEGGLANSVGGIFTNAAKITIGLNAGVGLTGLYNSAIFNNNTGGEITINRSSSAGLYNYVGGTFTNAAKISIGTITPTMANGLNNRGTFFNNAGGEITINNTTALGLISSSDNLSIYPPGTFTNAGKITIGATALASIGLTNANGATFNNNTGGEIKIDRSTSTGLYNEGGTFNNAAKITLGATASVGPRGILNQAIFNNNAGGEISIDNSTANGLRNLGGTFTNVAKITIGATASVGGSGIYNYAVFNNNAGGEIKIDNATGQGVENELGTFTNAAKITIGLTRSAGQYGIYNRSNGTFNNNNGGEIKIDNSTISGLYNHGGSFTNADKITIGATGSIGAYSIFNNASFTNNSGGTITLDNASVSALSASVGSTLTNAATILIGATVSIGSGSYGLANDGTINNTACGKLIVASGILQNNASRTITNTGLVQVAGTLDNNGTFTNNGVLKYGTLTGGSVSNTTNASLIVKNTPTPIFTYGGTYDGAVNGIFTDAAATLPAGTFTAPNTFVASGLSAGVQTLYAKITSQGGGCVYVVPFTYDVCAPTATPTGILTWTGLVDTDWNTACNWSPVSVPTATNDVIIPNTTNKPTISTAAVAQSVEVQTGAVLTIAATKSLTINGTRTVATLGAGFHNAGTVQNNGQLVLGSTSSVVRHGLINRATFNNNTGGEIKIDNVADMGLNNTTGATFTNAAKIAIGATANIGIQGILNDGTINNNAGGEMTIDRSTEIALFNQNGTFNNAAKLTIGGVESAGDEGIKSFNVFNNNAGGEIKIEKVVKNALSSGGPFANAGKIVIGASSVIESGILNGAVFDNNAGGEITIDRTTAAGLFNSGSSVPGVFNNAGKITIGALSSLGSTMGLGNINTFNNNACGQVIVVSGTISNDFSGSMTNTGLMYVVDNLENNGTFTNNGVLKYGSLTGTVINATNASLIVNNAPTPIFTYGGTYNGVVNGIFTDAAATASAGTFTAPNTFVPSGLPAGSQTLYAKITPQGGACSYIVPFTFNNSVLAPVFTTHPTAITRCLGSSASFTVAATNATGYQWQFNSGGGWSNVPTSAPYANSTTNTLSISNVAGLNGYQFRCVAIGTGVNTNSNSATLTVVGKPTISLTALQQTLNEGNNPVLCDIDANPVNGLQFTVSSGCVVGTPVWRVQVGSGAWSNWSATAPVSQSSNNQLHRYQAACDASCPSTYTSPIELTINYRASLPQNVSLQVSGVTVAAGESRELCSPTTPTLNFAGTCAAGEVVLYSVDGGDYSSTVPVAVVDNQFHNYRVRCRKSDGTISCVETESGAMRLKLTPIPSSPTVSLSSTGGNCSSPTSFSGLSSCGSLKTIWYNATTNVALPNLPSQTPTETTSYYARCQTENGCESANSNVVTYTVVTTQVAPIITASQEIVCTGTTVRVSANCPAGSQTFWNTGVTAPSFEVAFNNVTKQTYWAKCLFEGGCQSAESMKKDVYWNAYVVTLINIGQSKSAVKVSNDKSLWASQFITRDGGPELEQSSQINPTLYHVENVNKMAPRYWTINVDACGLGTDGSLTFDLLATPETGVPQSYNTHENNAPYFMYANREGWTELYAQNHPAYGFYQDNGVGGNVYDAGLPKGLYKLSIRYWDQKGWGSIYPSTRKPQGNVLAYQEYWFRIQSKDGVGVGAARVSESGQPTAVSEEATNLSPWKGLNPSVFATVLPNPVTNVLRLKVQESKGQVVQTTLMDAAGREVLRRNFVPQTNTHQEEFGVNELPTGMYFLKVATADQQATLKVAKMP